jgi:dTDP-4-dehydrorhamnose reductase
MNILVTGSNGQLGNEIRKISANYPAYRFFFTDVAELDITDERAVEKYFLHHKIQFVVNCAAYTAVDKAEENEFMATRINAMAVKILARMCDDYQATLIHVSTDYVYDGCACKPYSEDHYTAPASAYGRSKLAGEEAALSTPKSVVIRTSWLYSSFGSNFVKTMLRLGKERDSLNVVFDQAGTPTYAADLAVAIIAVISQTGDRDGLQRGIFHYSNEGVCSWYDFAHEIMQLAGLTCKVNPVEAKDYPTPAARPHYSVLNKTRIKAAYGIEIPHWRDSLKKCLIELLQQN